MLNLLNYESREIVGFAPHHGFEPRCDVRSGMAALFGAHRCFCWVMVAARS